MGVGRALAARPVHGHPRRRTLAWVGTDEVRGRGWSYRHRGLKPGLRERKLRPRLHARGPHIPSERQTSPGTPDKDVPGLHRVGDTGLEPVTSSVSRKRASQPAPIARGRAVLLSCRSVVLLAVRISRVARWRRDLNPCTRLCRPLPRLSATPPQQAVGPVSSGRRDSNPRPSPWQGDALPAALRPRSGPPARRSGSPTIADPPEPPQTASHPRES